MKVLYLNDYEETQLDLKIIYLIEGRKWLVQDNYGHKYYGFWSEEQAERVINQAKQAYYP